MQKLILIIISLFTICYSQELDYSKMSDAEKAMVYNAWKKSPALAFILEASIPSAGYAYTNNNWKRMLCLKVADVYLYSSGLSLIRDADSGFEFYLGMSLSLIGVYGYLEKTYRVVVNASKYNKRLYRRIYNKEKPKIKTALYPLQDGAGISLTYSFN